MIEYFDQEDIIFDAVYSRLKAFKKEETFCNYNQIYIDFDILTEGDIVNE